MIHQMTTNKCHYRSFIKDRQVIYQVTTSDNKWYNERKRMTTSDNELQRMPTSEKKSQ